MKLVHYILIAVIIGCSKEQRDDCFTSLGNDITTSRDIESFTQLKVSDRIEVVLSNDSTLQNRIEFTAPENLLPQIKSEVIDGQLQLFNTNTCNFVRSFNYSIKARIYAKEIEEIRIESIATVSTKDTIKIENLDIFNLALSKSNIVVDANQVFVQSGNSAQTILSGKSRVLKGSIEEVSDLDAGALLCEEVLLDTHTPYNCYVNGIKGLFVRIFNSGNIFYKLEPSEYKEVNVKRGSGDLLKK